MNAIMQASHSKTLLQEFLRAFVQYCISKRFKDPVVFWIYMRATSSGREAARV